jgi:hypothetical protein
MGTKHHGGTHRVQGVIHRGGLKPPKNQIHVGSGRPLGQLHEAPTRPAVNSANYGAQKVKRK